jgi:hypothetical protein
MSTWTQSVSENFGSKKIQELRELAWKWKIDLALLMASLFCFSVFAYRSIYQDQLGGLQGPIAKLEEGSAERKPSGTLEFSPIPVGELLYNLDAIWVGKAGHARLHFESGGELELEEKTLLILKRPFKNGVRSIEEEIKIVKGQAKTPDGKNLTPDPEHSPLSTSEPPEEAGSARIQLYPKNQLTLYRKETAAIPMTFAWPQRATGTLVLQDTLSGHKNYWTLADQNSYSIQLEQPSTYFWQILDVDGKMLVGPNTFTVRSLDESVARELLKTGTPSPSEIHW